MEQPTVTDLDDLLETGEPSEAPRWIPPGPPPTPVPGEPVQSTPHRRTDESKAPRRRALRLLVILLTVSVALTLVAALALATPLRGAVEDGFRSLSGGSSGSAPNPAPPSAAGGADGEPVLTASLDGRKELRFDLVTGATSVSVRGADLGGNLYRVATPTGGNAVPKIVDQGNRVMLQLVSTRETGPSAVEIQLSSKVRWDLRLTGGATEHVVDMGPAQLAGFEVLGGATRLELAIPEPKGTVPIRINSGLGQLNLTTPKGSASRIKIGVGSEAVTLDGNARGRVRPGTVFTPNGWDATKDRYDINVAAGVGSLTLRRP